MKIVSKLLACSLGLFAAMPLHAATNAISDIVGFFKVTLIPGPNSVSPPMQPLASFRGVINNITGVPGSNVTFAGNPNFTVNQFSPVTVSGFKRNQYVLMVRETSSTNAGDWWKIESNTADTVTVDVMGEDLSATIVPGTRFEIRKMTSIADMFGDSSNSVFFPSPSLAPSTNGDIVRFYNGTAFSAQQIILTSSGTGTATNYRVGAGNWTNGAQLTIEPDDGVIFFRRLDKPTTNFTSLGQAPERPTTHYINEGGYVFSSPFPGPAPWGASGLSNAVGLAGGTSLAPSTSRDVIRAINGTAFGAQQVLWYTGVATAGIPAPPSFIIGASLADNVVTNQLTPGRSYVYIRKVGAGGLVWRQSAHYTNTAFYPP